MQYKRTNNLFKSKSVKLYLKRKMKIRLIFN